MSVSLVVSFLNASCFLVALSLQAVAAVFGTRQDVDDSDCRSLSAGLHDLRRGEEAEQPCHHAGWKECQPGLQVC